MKKDYVNPSCDVAHIHLGSVLCGSNDAQLTPPSPDKKDDPVNAF